jgi:hypothetical protein
MAYALIASWYARWFSKPWHVFKTLLMVVDVARVARPTTADILLATFIDNDSRVTEGNYRRRARINIRQYCLLCLHTVMHARLNALEILLVVDYDVIVGNNATGAVHQRELLHINIPHDNRTIVSNINCF